MSGEHVVGALYPCERCGQEYTARRVYHRFCSEACQRNQYNAEGRPKKPILVAELVCDMCSVQPSPRNPVLRFALKRAVKATGASRATTRSVGTVFLCQRCWRATAAKRRRLTGPRRIVEVAA